MTGPVLSLVGLDVEPGSRHFLHDPERTWSQTNCYTDLWVQLLNRLGLDPVPSLAFVLATRFEGEQWTFAKPPIEDLFTLYSIRINELFVWRPMVDHVAAAAEHRGLLTTEVDAHWLPDTSGTTYRTGHEKTTIVPVSLDQSNRELRYLHNSGCFTLDGEDYDALLGQGVVALPAYTELIDLSDVRTSPVDAAEFERLVGVHLARRPAGNAVADLTKQLLSDLGWLGEAGVEAFHLYAFATVRQLGAVATMAGAVADRLDDASSAGDDFRAVADGAKTAQFLMARAARGRSVEIEPVLAEMSDAWERAMAELTRRHDG